MKVQDFQLHEATLRSLGVTAVYLFGSRAQETAHFASDFDFAVLLDHPSVLQDRTSRKKLYDALFDLFAQTAGEPSDIDIVFLQEADNQMQFQATRGGNVLLDLNPSVRLRFEEQALEEHADFEPHRRVFEQAAWDRLVS